MQRQEGRKRKRKKGGKRGAGRRGGMSGTEVMVKSIKPQARVGLGTTATAEIGRGRFVDVVLERLTLTVKV